MSTPLLTFAQFKARTTMPHGDVDAVAGVFWLKYSSDATALDTVAETPAGQLDDDGTVTLCQLVPQGPLVPNAANYAIITVSKRTAGGAPVTIATLLTTVLAWAAKIGTQIPISAGAVNAGDVITVSVTKQGTGVIVPAFEVVLSTTPNWVDRRIAFHQSKIEARLRKRYILPFDATSPPEILRHWLTTFVTYDCYRKRGVNPNDASVIDARDFALAALDELKEAADSENGLFDLPALDSDPSKSAVAEEAPLMSSDLTPYDWMDRDAQRLA